jgi:glycosyltransferase involved in cell wall biosynthesis
LKIANIIEEGRLAGPQIRIAEVARLLSKKNCETTVIFPEEDSFAFHDRLHRYEIPHFRLPLQRLSRNPRRLAKYLLSFISEIYILKRFFRENNFDIIHASGGAWQYKGAIAGKLSGCKVIWHLNDTQMPWLIRNFFRLIAKLCADAFIVAGQRVRKYYLTSFNAFRNKLAFEIQAPVNFAYFDPSKVKPDFRIAKYETSKIVSVGNINPLKGFEYLLKAAYLLNGSSHQLDFFIIGPHLISQKQYSKKLDIIKKKLDLHNVHFLGAISDIRGFLKAADLYVCSSISEASPISIWEAMSMEKAIVSTDVGDVTRHIQDSKNGFIVPIKDPQALAEKIDFLIGNYELRKTFGEKARQTAKQHLDVEIIAEQHILAYNALLKS